MKKISIDQVVSITSKQPFTANSLKFLQDALDEDKAAIVKAFITQTVGSYSLTVPYVISGCVVSDTNKDVTAGEIFYGGKFYEVTAVNGTTNVAQFILTKTQDATADPVTFTDGVPKNVHDVYKYVGTDTATPGDFDATDFVSAYGVGKLSFENEPVTQTITSATLVDLTGATYTTPNDGVTRTWLILGKSNADIGSGSAADGAELRILIDGVSESISRTRIDVAGSNVDDFVGSLHCQKLASVAPNKVIKLQIVSLDGGSIDFINNSFIVIQI